MLAEAHGEEFCLQACLTPPPVLPVNSVTLLSQGTVSGPPVPFHFKAKETWHSLCQVPLILKSITGITAVIITCS